MTILNEQYNNHIFTVDKVSKAIHLWNDLHIVFLKNGSKYLVSKYGFVGAIGNSTIYKGRYSNRTIDLTDEQMKIIKEIVNQ